MARDAPNPSSAPRPNLNHPHPNPHPHPHPHTHPHTHPHPNPSASPHPHPNTNQVGSPLAGIDDAELCIDTRPHCEALNDLITLNKETGERGNP